MTVNRDISRNPDVSSSSTFSIRGEEVILRAHQFIGPDLYAIEHMLKSGIEPNYAALFGAQAQAKIAALTLLTRQKLLDIHHGAIPSRDLQDARQDMANYVKILFHLKATDALGVFYDLAVKYMRMGSSDMWTNVRTRSLVLMGVLTGSDRSVLYFVHQRPEALEHLEALTASTNPELATPAKKLLSSYRVFQKSPRVHDQIPPTPQYLLLYQQYARELAEDDAIGISTWLTAKDRIEQVVMAGDLPSTLQWITEGSPDALRETLRFARSLLTPAQYIDLLERSLYYEGIMAERKKHIVLELGSLNRKANHPEGDPTLNRIIAHAAITADESTLDVAQSAIQALVSVNANKSLLEVIMEAPCLRVAESAIDILREQRHLHLLKTVVEKRPQLRPALLAAQRYLAELQELMDAASGSPSDDTTMFYLEQLKARHAIHELRELARPESRISSLAIRMLQEIDPGLVVDYYGGKR